MKKSGHTVFNYSDVFFSYHFSDERRCSSMAREHYLVYVYSGEYIVEEGGKTIVARAGDCIFIRRDNRVNMIKQSLGDEPFQGIFLFFKRNFLRKVLHKFEKTDLPLDADRMKKSVVKLPDSPDIKSLFTSMVPYFDSSQKPAAGMMDLKMLEAIYSLLNIDPQFYPALFDFTEP